MIHNHCNSHIIWLDDHLRFQSLERYKVSIFLVITVVKIVGKLWTDLCVLFSSLTVEGAVIKLLSPR